jgi:hypothetical protein
MKLLLLQFDHAQVLLSFLHIHTLFRTVPKNHFSAQRSDMWTAFFSDDSTTSVALSSAQFYFILHFTSMLALNRSLHALLINFDTLILGAFFIGHINQHRNASACRSGKRNFGTIPAGG